MFETETQEVIIRSLQSITKKEYINLDAGGGGMVPTYNFLKEK